MKKMFDYSYVLNNLPGDMKTRKIKSIKKVGTKPVYEITVHEAHSYILGNGVIKTNTGNIYAADNIFIIGRRQEKGDDMILNEKNVVVGYNFILKTYKSRSVREDVAIPLEVRYSSGINKCSGLFDLALQFGFLVKDGHQYTRPDIDLDGKKYYRKSIEEMGMSYWKSLLDLPKFQTTLADAFKIHEINMFDENALLSDDAFNIDGIEEDEVDFADVANQNVKILSGDLAVFGEPGHETLFNPNTGEYQGEVLDD